MTSSNPDLGELLPLVARLQGMLVSREVAAAAVEQLAEVARDMIDSAVGAGASLIDADGTRVSTATTDRVAARADELQYRLGEGPCLSAWATSAVQRLDDTDADDRWPTWSAAARGLGIRSVLSVPLVFRDDCIGALKIYSTGAAAFDAEDERRLVLLSTAAAALLGMARGDDGPRQLSAALAGAMADRQTIAIATGVLMERNRVDREAAHYLLLDQSRREGESLVQVARELLGDHSERAQ